jgi:site-specific DNA recombinase
MSQRAVIYCRVSTKEQTQNLSLPVQQRACLDYCEKHGFEVARVFIEEGESAKTADRPELQELLVYCRQNRGRLHCLVVYTVDRLAREQYDHAVIRRFLAGLGMTLRAAAQPIDDTPTGRAMEGMLSVFAQFDNELKAEKVKESMRAALKRGQWCFQAPVGYLQVSEAGRKTLLPDPRTAPMVREAFEMYATGLHHRNEVLERMNARGLRTRKGKPMSPQSFAALLVNPIYLGRIQLPEWGIDVPGNFPALVEEETFFRVQALLGGQGLSVTARQRSRDGFPLRGLITCEKCGRPLTGSLSRGKLGRRYAYYHCPPMARCAAVRVRVEVMEERFLVLLEQLRPKPEYMRLFSAIVLDRWAERTREVTARKEALESSVRTLKARRQRLHDLFIFEEAIDQATYREQLARLAQEVAATELKLHDARLEEIDAEAVVDFACHLATNASRLWLEASLEQKQRLQKVLFPAGLTWSDDAVRTRGSSSFFEDFGLPAESEEAWYPQRDSNPRCCLERAES